jgi:hypothetical protein
MRWKSVTLILVLDAIFFCMAAIGAAAAEQPASAPCETPYESKHVLHQGDRGWSYDYRLVWCAADGKITWWQSEVVVDEGECRWEGSGDFPVPVPESDDLTVLNIGAFLCPDDSEKRPKPENPWGIVGISPRGESWISAMGIS